MLHPNKKHCTGFSDKDSTRALRQASSKSQCSDRSVSLDREAPGRAQAQNKFTSIPTRPPGFKQKVHLAPDVLDEAVQNNNHHNPLNHRQDSARSELRAQTTNRRRKTSSLHLHSFQIPIQIPPFSNVASSHHELPFPISTVARHLQLRPNAMRWSI